VVARGFVFLGWTNLAEGGAGGDGLKLEI